MRRRQFIAVLGGVAARPSTLWGQQPERIRHIGVLVGFEASDTQAQELLNAFRTGLEDSGWREGRNLKIEVRYAGTKPELLIPLATELVELPVEVIVTHGTPAVQAAREVSAGLPLIFATIGDPVGAGLVNSLARPGGSITGLSLLATDLATKRLELLREVLPTLTRVAMLWNPKNTSLALQYEETRAAAERLKLEVQSLSVERVEDLEPAIAAAAASGADAIITTSDTIQISRRVEIIELAKRHQLCVVGESREIAVAGALLSYGPSRSDNWRRAAAYVDRVLKGAKPADLPVEQPTKFELVVNLKTARALNVDLPPTILARADEVIE